MSDVDSTALPGEFMHEREKIPLDIPPSVSCEKIPLDIPPSVSCFGGLMGEVCEWARRVATRIG